MSWARAPIRYPGWVGSGGGSLALAWPSLWPHSVSAQKMLDNASFTLYEFWRDEASWRRYEWYLKVHIEYGPWSESGLGSNQPLLFTGCVTSGELLTYPL